MTRLWTDGVKLNNNSIKKERARERERALRCSQRRQGRCVSGCSSRTRGSRRRREQKSGSDLHFWTPKHIQQKKKKQDFCSVFFIWKKIAQKSLTGGALFGLRWVFWISNRSGCAPRYSSIEFWISPLMFLHRLFIFELNADHFRISLHKVVFFPLLQS